MGLIDDLYAEINGHNSAIDANNAKISRLEVVKKDIADAKDEADQLKTNWNDNFVTAFAADGTWYGTNKNTVVECSQDYVPPAYDTYIDNTDAVLDAICDKITALKAENNDHYGAIGWLNSRIQSLLNEIEKKVN